MRGSGEAGEGACRFGPITRQRPPPPSIARSFFSPRAGRGERKAIPFSRRDCARRVSMSNSHIERPVSCSPDGAERNPGYDQRAFSRPRISLRSIRATKLFAARFRQIKGKAERRQSHCRQSRTERVRSRHGRSGLRRPFRSRARSPAGVPPRFFPRGVWSLGAIRARFRGHTVQGAGVPPPTA